VAPFTPVSLLTMIDILQLARCSLILMAALREVVPVGPAILRALTCDTTCLRVAVTRRVS